MSDRRRKYTENSVVASIGQIQAMLAAEEQPARPSQPPPSPRSIAPADAPAPPDEAELARPVAMPVNAGGAVGVPSWEEVQDNRAARWANESQNAVMVRSVSRWRAWRGRVLWAAVTISLMGASAAVMWWLRPTLTDSQPFAIPYLEAMHAGEMTGQAYMGQQALGALQAERDALALERDTLKSRVEAAEARAKDAAVIAATVAGAKTGDAKPEPVKRRRVRKRRSSKRKSVRRKRRSSRTTKTDKNLEGLLNSL